MRYVLLIYANEAAEASFSPEEQQAMFAAHLAYASEMREQGVMGSGEPLLPTRRRLRTARSPRPPSSLAASM
jgi:hypothetical protein